MVLFLGFVRRGSANTCICGKCRCQPNRRTLVLACPARSSPSRGWYSGLTCV